MAKTGLTNSIFEAAALIAMGRSGFATRGKEAEGRLSYEAGITLALSVFNEAGASGDLYTMILVEETFLQRELSFCPEDDAYAQRSLMQALEAFDDAFLCLEVVDEPAYITAEKTYPHIPKYRVQTFPKDAFHIACISHRTRLQNSLRTPGTDMIEKTVLAQRIVNMKTAQQNYVTKQQKTLEKYGRNEIV